MFFSAKHVALEASPPLMGASSLIMCARSKICTCFLNGSDRDYKWPQAPLAPLRPDLDTSKLAHASSRHWGISNSDAPKFQICPYARYNTIIQMFWSDREGNKSAVLPKICILLLNLILIFSSCWNNKAINTANPFQNAFKVLFFNFLK